MEETGNKSDKNASEQSKTPCEAHPGPDRMATSEEYNQDLKERLEEKNGRKIIKFEELINIAPDFTLWLKEIVRYGNVDSQALIFWDINAKTFNDDGNHFSVTLYTSDHKYSLYGCTPTERKPKGYLGAGASTRKPKPGEFWDRGNDLPDGSYSKETFDNIMYGIVSYELKNLQLWRK